MPRIMVIEDERVLAKNFREKLAAAGYEVAMAHTAKDAEAMIGSFSPDVVILDLRLPDGDGLQLLPRLKGDEPSMQVIVVTAQAGPPILKTASWTNAPGPAQPGRSADGQGAGAGFDKDHG